MSPIASSAIIDPLHAFVNGAFISGTERAIPFQSTRFDVQIAHGLSIVSTIRTFRNDEPKSIEATITFPIPVHAVLFQLIVRIDDRVLKGKAQRKSQARETYEDALERGKTAVLHEEVLRGVHMLSVGHIPAGAEIVVATSWAMTLTNINGRGRLRIPLTVGEIYGQSALPDSDDLICGGPNQTAQLKVSCIDGQVKLLDGRLRDGEATVPLNAPIDLEVNNWTTHDLIGHASDGRKVTLRIEPSAVSNAALEVALVVDRSGSMQEQCSAGRRRTKHAAIVRCLQDIASSIGLGDVIDIWEFNDDFNHVGSTRGGQNLKVLAKRLNNPDGGTNIGRALENIGAQSNVRDVLLITDGKSHALDVQALAQTGHRYSVVLIGEDSLEANVGYLAALTGGDVFVSSGVDLAEVTNQALRSLRTGHTAIGQIKGSIEKLSACRAGMQIVAEWQRTDDPLPDTIDARAVAAFSATLALPALDAGSATDLAEKEELVTHLTSLVLVDEAAAVQEGIPGTRKIPLPTPRTALHAMDAALLATACAAPQMATLEPVDRILSFPSRASDPDEFFTEPRRSYDVFLPPPFARLAELIEQSPAKLMPARAGRVLHEAGFGEIDEISQRTQHLGIRPDPILAIILAGMLRGPIGEYLSIGTYGANTKLQEFARRAMEAIRVAGAGASGMMRAIKDIDGLDIVQPSRADEAFQALGRIAGYVELLQHIEHFISQQNKQLADYQAASALRAHPAGYQDISSIGAYICWDVEPDRLQRGDLSMLDRSLADALQDIAANAGVRALANQLGIDPISMAVGLIARSQAKSNRAAARIAKAILGDALDEQLVKVALQVQIE